MAIARATTPSIRPVLFFLAKMRLSFWSASSTALAAFQRRQGFALTCRVTSFSAFSISSMERGIHRPESLAR
ncbi:hypothetical protein D3C77_731910 [compost metagenome]